MAGYSGTPLTTKLGIRSGQVVCVLDEPAGFRSLLDPLPGGVVFKVQVRGALDVVVLFVIARKALERRLPAVSRAIFPNGALWVAWPNRASGVATDITEDVIREVVLPTGLVDDKVCAIDETWSGLRVVHRRERRVRPT